ncbi:hypothetical protein FB566_2943 [Stackebrandtia endophytica]|uniref:Uncharacterized protein n=2 Tax=Stackebrandtia endophytica TaxID=1496996 RepID=A0A543AXS9_9ACTN|nr:hypothetical protein FB566_2943 [Stackebrandtia endophytica]
MTATATANSIANSTIPTIPTTVSGPRATIIANPWLAVPHAMRTAAPATTKARERPIGLFIKTRMPVATVAITIVRSISSDETYGSITAKFRSFSATSDAMWYTETPETIADTRYPTPMANRPIAPMMIPAGRRGGAGNGEYTGGGAANGGGGCPTSPEVG